MGGAVEGRPHRRGLLIQTREHVVDGDRQSVKFVAGSSDRQAACEIAGDDLLAGGGDRPHPRHQAAAQPQPHECPQKCRRADGPQCRRAKALLELAPFRDLRADEEAIAVRKFDHARTHRIAHDSAIAQRFDVKFEPALLRHAVERPRGEIARALCKRRIDEEVDRPGPAPAFAQPRQLRDDAVLSLAIVFVGERVEFDQNDVVHLIRQHTAGYQINRAQ